MKTETAPMLELSVLDRGHGHSSFYVTMNGNAISEPLEKDVAAYIVRAVNAHEELVNALKEVRADLEGIDPIHGASEAKDCDVCIVHDKITKALVKAEAR